MEPDNTYNTNPLSDEPPSITPAEAFAYLDNVASQYRGTRRDHEILGESLRLFKKLLRDRAISL